MTCESLARTWHETSDHARDGAPFGGYLCNCEQTADRILTFLREHGCGEPCCTDTEE